MPLITMMTVTKKDNITDYDMNMLLMISMRSMIVTLTTKNGLNIL